MPHVESIDFPDYIDLTDWILLIRIKGSIACEIHYQDGAFQEFQISASELSAMSAPELRAIIETKSKTTPIRSQTKKIKNLPTLALVSKTAA